MSEPKEFRVTMQLRNNRMLEMREARGWTQGQAAAVCGVPLQQWGGLETLRIHPMRWYGGRSMARVMNWSRSAMAIAGALEVAPEHLWPDAVLAVEGGARSLRMSAVEAKELMGSIAPPDALTERGDERDVVIRAMASLTPREGEVLRMRFGIGDQTHSRQASRAMCNSEIGKRFGVTRERIRQIEVGALRKMKKLMRHQQP